MRSLILSQCRDLRIGVTREDLGALTTVRARHTTDVYFLFRHRITNTDIPRPIAVKLCHGLHGRYLDAHIMQVQKFGVPPKNRQNLGRFYTTSNFGRKCLWNE